MFIVRIWLFKRNWFHDRTLLNAHHLPALSSPSHLEAFLCLWVDDVVFFWWLLTNECQVDNFASVPLAPLRSACLQTQEVCISVCLIKDPKGLGLIVPAEMRLQRQRTKTGSATLPPKIQGGGQPSPCLSPPSFAMLQLQIYNPSGKTVFHQVCKKNPNFQPTPPPPMASWPPARKTRFMVEHIKLAPQVHG